MIWLCAALVWMLAVVIVMCALILGKQADRIRADMDRANQPRTSLPVAFYGRGGGPHGK